MRSRSYKFTGKVVPPTAGPVPPATWNRGNSHVLRSRRGPAAVPPIVIAYFRTRKHCQVYCRVRHGIVVIPTFRCPPAAVPPRGIAWVPTQKQHQVLAGTWWSNHHGHDRCRIHQLRYFPKSKTNFSRSTPVQIQCAPIETLTPSGRTMNMTLPTSASIALCRIYTTIGNAIEYTQSCQNSREYT